MSQVDLKLPCLWQVVFFMINNKANHVGLSIPEHGLVDLSLLGARIVPWDAPSLPKGERYSFDIFVPDKDAPMAFFRKPGLLMRPIIEKERTNRGWHLTEDAPDYVRFFREKRSIDPENMNCVEWIVYGLELGGVVLPDDLLTPTDLLRWCKTHYSLTDLRK